MKVYFITMVFCSMVILTGTGNADIIYSNFFPGDKLIRSHWGIAAYPDQHKIRIAMAFTVENRDYTLKSVTVPIACFKGYPEDLSISIAGSTDGKLSDILELLSYEEPIWPVMDVDHDPLPPPVTLDSENQPLLHAGETYWIIVEPTREEEKTVFGWFLGISDDEAIGSEVALGGNDFTGNWIIAGGTRSALRVEGTATTVPEPSSIHCICFAMCFVVTINILHKKNLRKGRQF